MKKLTLLLVFTSCQWVITHPREDAEVVRIGEEIASEIYKYECGEQKPQQPQQLPVTP